MYGSTVKTAMTFMLTLRMDILDSTERPKQLDSQSPLRHIRSSRNCKTDDRVFTCQRCNASSPTQNCVGQRVGLMMRWGPCAYRKLEASFGVGYCVSGGGSSQLRIVLPPAFRLPSCDSLPPATNCKTHSRTFCVFRSCGRPCSREASSFAL